MLRERERELRVHNLWTAVFPSFGHPCHHRSAGHFVDGGLKSALVEFLMSRSLEWNGVKWCRSVGGHQAAHVNERMTVRAECSWVGPPREDARFEQAGRTTS